MAFYIRFFCGKTLLWDGRQSPNLRSIGTSTSDASLFPSRKSVTSSIYEGLNVFLIRTGYLTPRHHPEPGHRVKERCYI